MQNNGFRDSEHVILPPRVLFHGSSKVLNILEPNVSDGGANENREDALIYATDHPEYAIFLSIIDIQETGRAGVSFGKDDAIDIHVNKEFMDGPSRFVEGYLHVLDATGFTQQENHEFTIGGFLKPLFCIQVQKDDLHTKIAIKP